MAKNIKPGTWQIGAYTWPTADAETMHLMVLKGGFACEATATEFNEWNAHCVAHPVFKRWEAAWVKDDRATMAKADRQLFNVGKKWFAGLVKRRAMKPAK